MESWHYVMSLFTPCNFPSSEALNISCSINIAFSCLLFNILHFPNGGQILLASLHLSLSLSLVFCIHSIRLCLGKGFSSGLAVLSFPHINHSTFCGLHCILWEICDHSNFSESLLFSIMTCLGLSGLAVCYWFWVYTLTGLHSFEISLFGACWASWISKFMFLSNLGSFLLLVRILFSKT